MQWIYLSPHLDDVALSCGGLLWEQAQRGQKTAVWTICAGNPPNAPLSDFAQQLHTRWQINQQAAAQRRTEDKAANAHLSTQTRHFDIPDCIYRRDPLNGQALYDSEEAIFGELRAVEYPLVERLAYLLMDKLPAKARIVAPLSLGGHVDHRLTRAAAEYLPKKLLYYADYPYAASKTSQRALQNLQKRGWRKQVFSISEQGLSVWQQAVAAHASQISSFWDGLDTMRQAIAQFQKEWQGVTLWTPPEG